jgi:hypothetical protein
MEIPQGNLLCSYLKQNQKTGGWNRSCLAGWYRARGMGEWTWCKYSVHMYKQEKMVSVETILGMGEGRNKEEWWRAHSTVTYLIYCENFCKCHNVSPPRTTIKKKKSVTHSFIYAQALADHSNNNNEYLHICYLSNTWHMPDSLNLKTSL